MGYASPQEPRTVRCARPITYCIPEGDQPAPLVYFLQTIFRKKEFRPGQVDILKRTLTRQNVIALLPTGAGKSLTYQLSALLQPGIVLVVDPLKSLMQDQDQNLRDAGIDATIFINSTINATERVQRQWSTVGASAAVSDPSTHLYPGRLARQSHPRSAAQLCDHPTL